MCAPVIMPAAAITDVSKIGAQHVAVFPDSPAAFLIKYEAGGVFIVYKIECATSITNGCESLRATCLSTIHQGRTNSNVLSLYAVISTGSGTSSWATICVIFAGEAR